MKKIGDWVDVKDRLPENEDPVLCLFDHGEITVCCWYDGKRWGFAIHCDCCCDLLRYGDGPTHWAEIIEVSP